MYFRFIFFWLALSAGGHIQVGRCLDDERLVVLVSSFVSHACTYVPSARSVLCILCEKRWVLVGHHGVLEGLPHNVLCLAVISDGLLYRPPSLQTQKKEN